MQAIIQKLPNNLQTTWHATVVENRHKDGKVAGFGYLTKCVEYVAESVNEPIYSKEALNSAEITASPPSNFTEKTETSKPLKFPLSRLKSTSLTTNLEPAPQTPLSHGAAHSRQTVASCCSLCEKSHDLEECKAFMKKSVDERRSFLNDKSLCFTCRKKRQFARSVTSLIPLYCMLTDSPTLVQFDRTSSNQLSWRDHLQHRYKKDKEKHKQHNNGPPLSQTQILGLQLLHLKMPPSHLNHSLEQMVLPHSLLRHPTCTSAQTHAVHKTHQPPANPPTPAQPMTLAQHRTPGQSTIPAQHATQVQRTTPTQRTTPAQHTTPGQLATSAQRTDKKLQLEESKQQHHEKVCSQSVALIQEEVSIPRVLCVTAARMKF